MKSTLDTRRPDKVLHETRGRNAVPSLHGIALQHWFGLQWRRLMALSERHFGFARQVLRNTINTLRRKDMAYQPKETQAPGLPDEACTSSRAGDRIMEIRANATYQDVLDAPDHKVAELIDGTLYLMSRPADVHAIAVSMLFGTLHSPYNVGIGGPGGWRIIFEPELHLDIDMKVTVPDIAGWQLDTIQKISTDHKFTVMPDWVCEVLSPSTRKKDLEVKLPLYGKSGIPFAWYLDPQAQTLDAYENRAGSLVQFASLKYNDPVCLPPFDAITFNLGLLWD